MTADTSKRSTRTLGDRYELDEFIGQGGMATVYRGTDTKLGRQVAIKVMKAELAGDSTFRERFRQEAQSAARMAHSTIVRVLDAGDDLIQTAEGPKRLPFIVMEYVDGKNLRQHLSERKFSVEETCRILDSVLTALEYSHRAGIVHRDIKPANIMITSNGRVKVMDFGIARAVSDTSSTLQQTTQILGTAAYFSPEQARGETVDSRTDIYAVGVLMYEMLTGRVPFIADSAVAVAYKHVSERPVPPRGRDARISEPLNAVTMHALIKDKNRRFKTAGEFRKALAEAAAGRMPDLDTVHVDAALATAENSMSASDITMRQISSNDNAGVGARPPAGWIWASIATVVAVVLAIGFWVLNLTPQGIFANNSRVVPALAGEAKQDASKQLLALGLKPQVIEEASEDVPEGNVTRTDPSAQSNLLEGDTITIYVSSGPDSVPMPDLTGMSVQDAQKTLTDIGLKIGTVSSLDHPSVPKDRVLGAVPKAGVKVKKNSAVKITVATGEVSVPDLKNQSLEAARTLLNGLGLTIVPQPKQCALMGAGLPVIEQSVVGKAPIGSEVSVSYCAGEARTTPPPRLATDNQQRNEN